jgi:hypothetical protein
MWRRHLRIVKGTSSIWSVMLSVSAMIAIVWIVALNIDPHWRLPVGAVGTIVCLLMPGGLASILWLCSPLYRKQWSEYRKGGPLPGYAPGKPWQGSPVGDSLKQYTEQYLTKTILSSHSEEFRRKLKEEMYGSVAAIYAAADPFLTCRADSDLIRPGVAT